MTQIFTSLAATGTHGFLTPDEVPAEIAAALVDQGFRFVVRSVLGPGTPDGSHLSQDEASALAEAGLAIMGLQPAGTESRALDQASGSAAGKLAADGADAAGMPRGCTLWLDLDNVDPDTTAEDVIAYCNAWHVAVSDAEYFPAIRVGENCGLASDTLYWRLRMKRYWRASSVSPEVAIRGYCALGADLGEEVIAGQTGSRLMITADSEGNTPTWAQPIGAPSENFDAPVLMRLAADQGLAIPMQRMIAFRDTHRPDTRPRFWCVVDFNRHSADPRLFLFDRVMEQVQGYLCSHGKGSEGPTDDGYASVFKNVDGSGCSSLGIYLCSEIYFGDHGKSMRLDGLEATNSRARHRAIVVHGADYVSAETIASSGRIGRSLGCPALDHDHVEHVVDALANGSLMNIWYTGQAN